MADISDVIRELETASPRIESNLRALVTKTASDLRSKFQSSSPEQTGSFKAGWRIGRATSAPGELASISIVNNEPHASAIEEGIDPSSTHSWAASVRKGTSKGVKKAMGINPKSVRIWSSKAVGGVSARNISDSVVRGLAKNVADSIIMALNKK